MRRNGFALVIILITLTLLVGIGFILLKFKAKNKEPSVSIIENISPTQSISQLQNWDITTSNNYVSLSDGDIKYSFSIPNNWKIQLVCNGGIKDDNYICLESPDLEQNAVPVVVKGQLIIIAPPGSGYYLGKTSQDPIDFCKESQMSKYSTCEKKELNGQKIIKRTSDNFSFVDVAILKNNKINLTIRLEYPYQVEYKDKTFDQFLSSFTASN